MTLSGRVASSRARGTGWARRTRASGSAVPGRARRCRIGAVQDVVASLEAEGATARGYRCDVRDPAAVAAFVDGVAEAFGGVDIVVSNAGIGDRAGGVGDTDEQWRQQFAVHVDGAFHLVRAAVPWLRRSRHPRIVIVSSEWALRVRDLPTDTRRPRARCWPSRVTSPSSWPGMECSSTRSPRGRSPPG